MEGLREAIEYITELAETAAAPEVLEIKGRTYCTKRLERYDKEPQARRIEATTLTALMDYIRENKEELRERMIIQVTSPREVRLFSGLTEERDREELFRTEAMVPEFSYGREYEQKEFMVKIQSCFEKGLADDQEAVQYLAGNIDASQEATYSDNGTTQLCVVKTGVANKENAMVPNPVTLTPYRTFVEIEQPESEFVFRIEQRGGAPLFKLIEADGGRWKNEAMLRIKDYILNEMEREPVEGVKITVIA